MHELSIAMNIIDIASEQAKISNLSVIDEIEIEIGTLSGVEIDALKFAMEIATKRTILENSKTIITEIPGQARCLICSKEFEIDSFYAQCPECKQFNFQIIQGQELRVKSLNVY
jgi:hydrogenase nickel incorporation protein HypA/HybF